MGRLTRLPADVRNDCMETCDLGITNLGLGIGIRSRVSVRASVR